jgi:hypothetical protein
MALASETHLFSNCVCPHHPAKLGVDWAVHMVQTPPVGEGLRVAVRVGVRVAVRVKVRVVVAGGLGVCETQPSGLGPGQILRGATVKRPQWLADSRRRMTSLIKLLSFVSSIAANSQKRKGSANPIHSFFQRITYRFCILLNRRIL